MLRALFRVLRIFRDAKAASRGPSALGRRYVRRSAHRSVGRALRKWL